jgi:uncharacterized membrane protein YkoI
MFRSKRVPAALAIMMMTAGPAAFAASTQTTLSGGKENRHDAAAVMGATVTPQQAIAAAEQNAGGHAMRIDFKHEKGADLYRVKVLVNGAAEIVKIDSSSGKVLSSEKPGIVERVLEREDKNEVTKLQNAKTTFVAAIDAAEKQTGGKTVEARVEDEDGHLAYEVQTVKDKTKQRVRVDVDTGQVVASTGDED